MQRWGNAKAKEYFEALVPKDYRIPTEHSPVRDKEIWIRDKYERKRFVSRDAEDPTAKRTNSSSRSKKVVESESEASDAEEQPAAAPAPAADILNFGDFSTPAPTAAPSGAFGNFGAPPAPAQTFDAFAAPPPAAPKQDEWAAFGGLSQQSNFGSNSAAQGQFGSTSKGSDPFQQGSHQAAKNNIMASFGTPQPPQNAFGNLGQPQQPFGQPQGFPQPGGFPPQQGFPPQPGFPGSLGQQPQLQQQQGGGGAFASINPLGGQGGFGGAPPAANQSGVVGMSAFGSGPKNNAPLSQPPQQFGQQPPFGGAAPGYSQPGNFGSNGNRGGVMPGGFPQVFVVNGGRKADIMSLLDLPMNVISMDDAEEHMIFDVDICKMEIFAEGRAGKEGVLAPTSAVSVSDAFCPSHNLVEDGFHDGVDDFGGLHLDNTGFDTMSFYEYGPFSPVASPKSGANADNAIKVEKVHSSFTTATHPPTTSSVDVVAANLPPKYFKTVQSSPQKRRIVSRTWKQIKSFSFASAFPTPDEKTPAPAEAKSSISTEPSREPESTSSLTKTPVRAVPTRRPPTATPIMAKPSTVYRTPMLPPKGATPATSHAMFVSPQEKILSSRLSSASSSSVGSGPVVGGILALNKWPLDKTNVSLPPRYLQGPHASPEKKRVHSATFGKTTSFSFGPSKTPKTDDIATMATMRRAQSLQ
ncbi:hypothetical protein DYB32_006881 [Aphanomyces invadans]|uniref:Arf-GAP domain-containing protein n=1 Tax=Aphanomyces invadans TaxID=157072 RepID=A0A418AQL4_9STRA|nr:hypothetical protein DYB32_006881 [Aphanomyces invadans]